MNNTTILFNTSVNGEKVTFYGYDSTTKTLTYPTTKGAKHIRLQDMHLGIQHGNIKVGKELILNTLPGDHFITVKGCPMTNLHGSCQGCCDGCEKFCYAIHGCKQHHNSVMPSVMKNLILYREDRERFLKELRMGLDAEVAKAEKKQKVLVFRWHSSGEIESPQYLEDMMTIANEYPSIHFYSYTKRFRWIKEYLDRYGDFPANFCWNLSVWENNLKDSGFPEKYLSKVQLFEWKDQITLEEYNSSVHCPAIGWDGKTKKGYLNHKPFSNGKSRTCVNCGICWKGKMKGKTIIAKNH